LSYRLLLGTGAPLFARAGSHIRSFRMHRATGARIEASDAAAAPGVHLSVGVAFLKVPCEVVWTENSEKRSGFGYGTLPGHQASGEEAFFVTHEADDRVWFHVVAYSRPARLLMRLGGPFAVGFQQIYARLCGRALKRLCTVNA
jgi:uncharacterized protein (UPF0548 family)